ncbi:hypothetical protein F2P81_007815 [Scophthalmus maximus]|uniref:Uncharacterized protein n=1 Tax=Scophthalmus maximus TaxID=52904 RepID=A0A6A4T6H3_SCOMX|nr:hypothetical protein F2P81_007815 [Scophthalmus maximus]
MQRRRESQVPRDGIKRGEKNLAGAPPARHHCLLLEKQTSVKRTDDVDACSAANVLEVKNEVDVAMVNHTAKADATR